MDAHHHGNLPSLATPKLAHNPVVDLASLGAAAPPHVGVTPTSDNAPWQARVEGNEKEDNRDFASDDANGKALSAMAARAALAGCALYELGEGGFLVGGRGYSKAAPDLRAVGDMLRQIGGR